MNSLTAIICIGISASGKSTWAKQLCFDDISFVELNRDDIRFPSGVKDWANYKFTRANETRVNDKITQKLLEAHQNGRNIVSSDTNLTAKYRDKLVEQLTGLGYTVEFKEFDIALEDAWKRDAARAGGVGHTVIYTQYQKYLQYKGRKVFQPKSELQKAIVCDIDGTVAKMVSRGPFEWDKVEQDHPRTLIIQMVENFASVNGYHIIFLSGRDGVCEDLTRQWIKTNIKCPFELFMRAPKDSRKDAVIKEELFWTHLAERYNIVASIDDRPCMIRLWHELGIDTVISVANPWVEF